MSDRVWQMMKIEAGLYLLPSNDRRWIFKLHKVELLSDVPKGYEVWWEVSQRDMVAFQYAATAFQQDPTLAQLGELMHNDLWEHVAYAKTRKEAIEEAMRWECRMMSRTV